MVARGCADLLERSTVIVPTIHRIRIEKFRKLQDRLTLDFTSPSGKASQEIVLAGPNGCGKTTVLEALLNALGQERLIVRDEERAARDLHWRTSYLPGTCIEIDVSLDGRDVVTWVRGHEISYVVDANGNRFDYPARATLDDLAVEYFSSWRTPELVGPVKPLVSRGGRPKNTESNRLWRLKQRINDARAKGGYGKTNIDKATSWLERINRAWARFHGHDRTTIDAQIVDDDAEEAFADLYVLRDGRRICTIDQVSSGEIELLSFAGWVILNDFEGGLIVIDEPELHLHPQWQKQMLPSLRELAPNAQFIVASHSDTIWDQTYSFARFLLLPDDDPRTKRTTDTEMDATVTPT